MKILDNKCHFSGLRGNEIKGRVVWLFPNESPLYQLISSKPAVVASPTLYEWMEDDLVANP